MGVADAKTGQLGTREVTLSADEGIRPDTTLEGVSKIRTAMPGGVVTAGNASQFSDGASAAVVMNGKVAAARACSRWVCSAVSRWPAASRMKWGSARCSPCPSCSGRRA